MFSHFSPMFRMSMAALTLIVLLFTTGDSAVHEQVAAPPSGFGEPAFKGGFSLPIIHRNHLRSPLRDPTVTTLDLFKEEIQLASAPLPADDALTSEKMLVPVRFLRGLYLVPLRIGGSLDRISSRYLMFDTATDLSWTQCTPCYTCARGHYPPYNPSKSSTFHSVSCDDSFCEHSAGLRCADFPSRECIFYRGYGDGISSASGYLVSDIFHFSFEGNYDYHFEPQVVFGCATSEWTSFVKEHNTGILALGNSRLSLQAQVGMDRFSYCVPATAGREDGDQTLSYLRFGSQALLSGKRIPFLTFEDKYIVYLNRVTYQHGNRLTQQQPVPIFPGDEANAKSKEKVLVDSGTLGLWLPGYIFYPLLRKIEADISLTRWPFDDNPNAYCYVGGMADVEQVSVTLGFVGGAEMLLYGDALFFEYIGRLICLGPFPHNMTILGIYPQRNTNMGFDLLKGEIAIDQAGCSL